MRDGKIGWLIGIYGIRERGRLCVLVIGIWNEERAVGKWFIGDGDRLSSPRRVFTYRSWFLLIRVESIFVELNLLLPINKMKFKKSHTLAFMKPSLKHKKNSTAWRHADYAD